MSDTEREVLARPESIEALEAAFARLVPIVREQLRAVAASIHPDMRAAGMQVLRVALHERRTGAGPVAVGEIITRTAQDKSVVSRQLRQLADWGLVTTRRSEHDRRVILVEATDLAVARHDAARGAMRMLNARILTTWPEEDVRQLTRLLTRLLDDRAQL